MQSLDKRPILRAVSFTLLTVVIFSCASANALQRIIRDCSLYEELGINHCAVDEFLYLNSGGSYVFGRSEDEPVRGPNPVPGGVWTGSTDVDDAYDMVETFHEYVESKFGRNGANNYGGAGTGAFEGEGGFDSYTVYVHAQISVGARIDPFISGPYGAAVFGSNQVEPGVFGHELAHIISKTLSRNPDGTWNGLNHAEPFNNIGSQQFNGETGTLAEAFSDIFGESFERYVIGSNDWLIISDGPVIRSLSDPTSATQYGFNSPDRYLHPDYFVGASYVEETHLNAGIPGKAAYLAAEGGSFNGYDITGIGLEKVEQIWYRAVTTYFAIDEKFNDAYGHLIQATEDLYGPAEVAAITKALQAVEMNLVRSTLPGDFDSDFNVDGADFLKWQRGAATGLVAWQENFGTNAPSVDKAVKSIPEPSSFTLLMLCCIVLVKNRGQRWKCSAKYYESSSRL